MCNNNESILTEQEIKDLEQYAFDSVIEEATDSQLREMDYCRLLTLQDILDLAEEVENIEVLRLILNIMINQAENRERMNNVIAELVDEATIE